MLSHPGAPEIRALRRVCEGKQRQAFTASLAPSCLWCEVHPGASPSLGQARPLHRPGGADPGKPGATGGGCQRLPGPCPPSHDPRRPLQVRIWEIPEGGLKRNMTEALLELHGHSRRVGLVEWHPTTNNILFSAGYDYKVSSPAAPAATASSGQGWEGFLPLDPERVHPHCPVHLSTHSFIQSFIHY